MDAKDQIIEMQKKAIELLQTAIEGYKRLDANSQTIISIYKKRAEAYEKIIMGKTDEKVNEPRSVTH